MTNVQGSSDPRFDSLREIFTAQLDSGEALGASVAVRIDDQPVVDLWGGWSDVAKTTPWASDTIVNVYSTTKTMTNLCALILHDRGELSVYEKVAAYWPEFAANGKADIEVRHLLSHTSGVSGWDQPITMDDVYDREKSTAHLAAQAPWWTPGTASGYHMLNQGHLVGEVIRRVSGRTLGRFFAEEVAAPLGADFQIGLDPSQFPRIADVVPPSEPPPIDFAALDPNGIPMKTFTGPLGSGEEANSEEWRRAEIGAANGHGNARSVALVQSVIANGGVANGVRLLSPETIKLIFEEQSNGVDLVLGIPLRFGIGYGLCSPTSATFFPDDPGICFWGGYGGSLIVMDTAHKLTVAYMMNKLSLGILGSAASVPIVAAALAAVR